MQSNPNPAGWSTTEMAQKVALDIFDGAYVNLGIGIPELVADYIPEGREVIYHTENGLLGMGKAAEKGKEDFELVNAGKKYVTAIPGAAFFHHADSFGMIRGGHIDICVLGAYQVSEEGDLANWSTGQLALHLPLYSILHTRYSRIHPTLFASSLPSAAVLSAHICWVTLSRTYPLTTVTAVRTHAKVRRCGSGQSSGGPPRTSSIRSRSRFPAMTCGSGCSTPPASP